MEKFQFTEGSRVPKGLDPNKAHSELERIREKYGALTAEAVVQESQAKDSVLHDVFEWNNDTAAENYRLQQARTFIRVIVRVYEDDQPSHREFVMVVPKVYEPAVEVVKRLDDYEIAVSRFKDRLEVVAGSITELEQLAKHHHKKLPTGLRTAFRKVEQMVAAI